MISSIQIYNLIKDKLGAEESQMLIDYVQQSVHQEVDSHKDTLATKEDIAKLEVRMESKFAETIRWMFLFWIGQIAVLSALLFTITRIYFEK